MRNLYFILFLALIFMFLACGGSKKEEAKSGTEAEKATSEAVAPETAQASAQKTNLPAPVWGEIKRAKNPVIMMETNLGNMEIELYWKETPKTAENFLYLVNKGFYDGLIFHRIIPQFVIQGGDPEGTGSGGPGYNIPDETSPIKHTYGCVAMAKTNEPNSAGSQFYICMKDLPHLDGKYTVFGKVIKGMETAEKIAKVPTGPNDMPQEKVIITKAYEKK
jgi:peptidyl-prolyl cis-trans isomerase B (cyclophilin B)